MLHDNQSQYPFGEIVWIAAGVIMLLAFGDILVLLVLGLAIVGLTAAWLAYRRVRHDERSSADLAAVIELRPGSALDRDPNTASAQAPWHGPSAA